MLPPVAKPGYTFLAPDGEIIYYVAEIFEGGHGTHNVEEIIHQHQRLLDFARQHLIERN